MTKDKITEAFNEWRQDAMKDLNSVPNRWEAFLAGWAAAEEYYGCERKKYTEMELRASRGGSDNPIL
jgi:hypothetical protein